MGSARLFKDQLAKIGFSTEEALFDASRDSGRDFPIVLSHRVGIGPCDEGRPQIPLHGQCDGRLLRSSWTTDHVSCSINCFSPFPGYFLTTFADASRTRYIVDEFGPELRRKAITDWLLRTTGVPDYVLMILTPELAVTLIKEDMRVCDEEKARRILQESRRLGETLHEDE
jgi:hypothetical protein